MLDGKEYIRWMGSSRRTLSSAIADADRGDFNWLALNVSKPLSL